MKTEQAKTRPASEVRFGNIRAAIWKNEGESGPWYNVTARDSLSLRRRSLDQRRMTNSPTVTRSTGGLRQRIPRLLGLSMDEEK